MIYCKRHLPCALNGNSSAFNVCYTKFWEKC